MRFFMFRHDSACPQIQIIDDLKANDPKYLQQLILVRLQNAKLDTPANLQFLDENFEHMSELNRGAANLCVDGIFTQKNFDVLRSCPPTATALAIILGRLNRHGILNQESRELLMTHGKKAVEI